jgi:hypothetical protein
LSPEIWTLGLLHDPAVYLQLAEPYSRLPLQPMSSTLADKAEFAALLPDQRNDVLTTLTL